MVYFTLYPLIKLWSQLKNNPIALTIISEECCLMFEKPIKFIEGFIGVGVLKFSKFIKIANLVF